MSLLTPAPIPPYRRRRRILPRWTPQQWYNNFAAGFLYGGGAYLVIIEDRWLIGLVFVTIGAFLFVTRDSQRGEGQ